MKKSPKLLIIFDGFGYSPDKEYNAIELANPKRFNYLKANLPSCLINAAGKYIGLLDWMIGNTEVGHLTIGSGRVVNQPVTEICKSINDGSFFKNQEVIERLQKIKDSNHSLHIMGLLSDAGVHSLIDHLFAFLKLANNIDIKKIYVHAFLDGRDVPPKSAKVYLEQLENYLQQLGVGKIASLHGRLYAMDRDNHWERTEKSYLALTEKLDDPLNTQFSNWREAIDNFYDNGITDEFILPTQLTDFRPIKPDDGVIFFNFRPDRARQITQVLVDPYFDGFKRNFIPLSWMITGTQFHPDFATYPLCKRYIVEETLPDILEQHGKTIFTIAETEKYAAVTYFFNGGKEVVRPNETRIMVPSIRKYKRYVDAPEMSAQQITDKIINSLQHDPHDFYVVNYANADMVGHSGNLEATIKAIKFLDSQLEQLFNAIQKYNGTIYLTSDHGNSEAMRNPETNEPITAHTVNKVPFLYIPNHQVATDFKLDLTELADIAPFILADIGLPVPEIMLQKKPIFSC